MYRSLLSLCAIATVAAASRDTTTTTAASRAPWSGFNFPLMQPASSGGVLDSFKNPLKNKFARKSHPAIINGTHYNSTDGSVVLQLFPIADFGWNFSPGGIGGFFTDPFFVTGKNCSGFFNIDAVHKPTFAASFDVDFAECDGEDDRSEFFLDLLPIPFETNLQCVLTPTSNMRNSKPALSSKLGKDQDLLAASTCSSSFGGGAELFELPVVQSAYNAESMLASMTKEEMGTWFYDNVILPKTAATSGRALLQGPDLVFSIIFPSLDDRAEVFFEYSALTGLVTELDVALTGNYLVAIIDFYTEGRTPPLDECDPGAIALSQDFCLNLFVGIAGLAGVWDEFELV